MEIEELLTMYAIESVGSMGLVRGRDMTRALDVCEAQSVVVLGIEAFEPVGSAVRPVGQLIADFSSLETLPLNQRIVRSVEAARAFVARIRDIDRYMFDLTID